MAQGGAGWGVGTVQMPRQGRVLDHQGSMGGPCSSTKIIHSILVWSFLS